MDRDALRQAAVVTAVAGGILSGATGEYGEAGASRSLVLPADYAFTIWGPIYAGAVVHAVHQARPSRRTDPLLRRTGWAAAAAYGLIGTWVRVQDRPRLQIAAIAVTAAVTATAYRRALPANAAEERSATDRWAVRIPYGLLAGWISLATLAGTTEALMAAGVRTPRPGPAAWATGALDASGAAATAVTLRVPVTTAYPAVVVWGLAATAVRVLPRRRAPGLTALLAAATVATAGVRDLGRRRARSGR